MIRFKLLKQDNSKLLVIWSISYWWNGLGVNCYICCRLPSSEQFLELCGFDSTAA